MIALATVIGVFLFALGLTGTSGGVGITGPIEGAIVAGSILLGAAMITVQIARLTASIEKQKK